VESLSESNISVNGKNVLIIGAGGASRAISYYLSEKTERLFLYDINKEKAERLVSALNLLQGRSNASFSNLLRLRRTSTFNEIDIIINATPLGLKEEDPLPLNTALLKPDQIVCDLIYKKTRLIEEASNKGCVIMDGRGMLLWQGVLAFELWTGKKPPVGIMRNALQKGIK
jgi:shikimate dehydrogenase